MPPLQEWVGVSAEWTALAQVNRIICGLWRPAAFMTFAPTSAGWPDGRLCACELTMSCGCDTTVEARKGVIVVLLTGLMVDVASLADEGFRVHGVGLRARPLRVRVGG